MTTEKWALLVSFVALLFSVGIPVWQWFAGNAQKIASKRTLLLQTILEAKSTVYVSMHELIHLLRKHGARMESEQHQNLEAMVPRMRAQHDELEQLHDQWSDYADGRGLDDIEQELATVNVISSDASDTAKLVENGRRSYEDT